jgi:hypothetical protein
MYLCYDATFGLRFAATNDPVSTLLAVSRPLNRHEDQRYPTQTLIIVSSTSHHAGSRQAVRGKAFAAARTGAKAKVRILSPHAPRYFTR